MNILIACSDVVMLGLLKQALSDDWVEVYTTNTEQGIVDACRQRSFAIIVTMFSHPFLNGNEMLMQIRRRGARHAKMCLLSCIQHEQTVVSLYENGVNQYFTLPVNMTRLARKIKESILEIQS